MKPNESGSNETDPNETDPNETGLMLEMIETAWAVRRYTNEPVTEREVGRCLKAAIQGPSGGNIQPWQFLVLTDPAVRAAVAGIYERAYHRYEKVLLSVRPPAKHAAEDKAFSVMLAASRHLAENLAAAPVHVLFLQPIMDLTLRDGEGPLDIGTPHASIYPAVQNFQLAARAQGIGTTLTTVFRIYLDEVREVCGVPDRYDIPALVPMGRPAGRFGRGRRRPLEQVVNWNRFGDRRAPEL